MFILSIVLTGATLGGTIGGAVATITGTSVATGTAVGTLIGAGTTAAACTVQGARGRSAPVRLSVQAGKEVTSVELLSTMIAGINVGSALCSALAALTGTNAVRTAAIGTLGGAVCGAALFADQQRRRASALA